MRQVLIPHPAPRAPVGGADMARPPHGRAMPEGRYESQMFLGSRGT